MPVRFQVDPDFYDHPKTAGMSDAAFSLWVRAGSYSAAKLTDGFVADHVLEFVLRSSKETADELVGRRLWKRSRGGYQFHQWNGRNLTRERVEDHRKSEAERKRDERERKKQQANRGGVRETSGRTESGVRPESDTVGVGVDVGVVSSSGSLGGEGLETYGEVEDPPPRGIDPRNPRCADHARIPRTERGPNCMACKAVREDLDHQAAAAAQLREAERHLRRQLITDCPDCDDENGWLLADDGRPIEPLRKCAHPKLVPA